MTDQADEVIASKFRRLVELRDERDEDKTRAERSEKRYREYEAELYDELAASPIRGSRKIDLGPELGTIVFTPRETYYGRVLDKDAALDYFDERAMTDEFTRADIAKGKLNAFVRDCIEQGKPLPPGIDFTANRGITISRKGGGTSTALTG